MDIKEINAQVIKQFRAGAEIEGMNRDGLLLLTTTGARSGHRRTTPMMFHRDHDRLLVIASNVGAAKHPDWYLNLLAHPRVVVEVGDERFEARAVPLAGSDRDRQWTMLKQAYPFFAEHEAKTSREIPVVALTRTEGTTAGE
jgi:deazaflavin-dependent oxidoreductase (nitroreductase family)